MGFSLIWNDLLVKIYKRIRSSKLMAGLLNELHCNFRPLNISFSPQYVICAGAYDDKLIGISEQHFNKCNTEVANYLFGL